MQKPRVFLTLLLVTVLTGPDLSATDTSSLKFRDDFVRELAGAVPSLLSRQDPQTGRFGSGVWIVTDQHSIYPLAVAWATKSDDNPYYHDPDVLESIMAAGDALAAAADGDGQWVFRKKDGSTWGRTYMPWTYSRWIRAYGLVRDAMPAARRTRWEDALLVGYSGIAKTELGQVHNMRAHQAMGLYIAGRELQRPQWCEQAKAFMVKVVEAQDPSGFWSENHGPVVRYNLVYVEALGTYYAVSGDPRVLPALERAAAFHAEFTYPDGSVVEAIDERNPYEPGIHLGNVGFTFSAVGRGHVGRLLRLAQKAGVRPDPDFLASFIHYGREGNMEAVVKRGDDSTFVLGRGKAVTYRKGSWFVCLSAFHCPVVENRWIQDRQNLVSIFHDRVGLIVGGGNTKLQPLWSSFTVGDVRLLRHTAGDENPRFVPEGGLVHVPSAASLRTVGPPALVLAYGSERCSIDVRPVDDDTLLIRVRATSVSGQPVAAHLTLIPHIGEEIRTERKANLKLGPEGYELTSEQTGSWVAHAGWRLSLPEGSRLVWPALPHNPYRKDGAANAKEGRLVVKMPFSEASSEYILTLSVPR